MKQFGERVREIRILKKMSQAELAFECKLDYSQINRMELGKVDVGISQIYKIADGLKVHANKLIL